MVLKAAASPRRKQRRVEIITDPVESAKAAGLRYTPDSKPGIQRRPWRKAFRYIAVDGSPLRDVEALGRIKSLAIPPAWKDVWICPNANGHLQATGRDAKGRKQNRYHPRWREVRDETKYERMLLFGKALPTIRERVEDDLAAVGLPRRKVLATIVRLMETTFMRVGNEEYARENRSYGLTTMRGKHVHVEGSTITFKFAGKSGVKHNINVSDRKLANIIRKCQDIPGYELFQYLDSDGEHHSIDSSDVNEYLREISGQDFTAKDFRTWAGTILACIMLREFQQFETDREAKKNVVRAIEAVAARLGNTPSVCRKCYVHPAVFECYMSGAMLKVAKQRVDQALEDEQEEVRDELRKEEAAVMQLLQKRLEAKVA